MVCREFEIDTWVILCKMKKKNYVCVRLDFASQYLPFCFILAVKIPTTMPFAARRVWVRIPVMPHPSGMTYCIHL